MEHYCQCTRVWRFGETALQVSCRISGGKETWFLAAPDNDEAQRDPKWWHRMGALHYSVLRATNGYRAAGAIASGEEEAHRALQQGLVEARCLEKSN